MEPHTQAPFTTQILQGLGTWCWSSAPEGHISGPSRVYQPWSDLQWGVRVWISSLPNTSDAAPGPPWAQRAQGSKEKGRRRGWVPLWSLKIKTRWKKLFRGARPRDKGKVIDSAFKVSLWHTWACEVSKSSFFFSSLWSVQDVHLKARKSYKHLRELLVFFLSRQNKSKAEVSLSTLLLLMFAITSFIFRATQRNFKRASSCRGGKYSDHTSEKRERGIEKRRKDKTAQTPSLHSSWNRWQEYTYISLSPSSHPG